MTPALRSPTCRVSGEGNNFKELAVVGVINDCLAGADRGKDVDRIIKKPVQLGVDPDPAAGTDTHKTVNIINVIGCDLASLQ